jgi:CcmD family protein
MTPHLIVLAQIATPEQVLQHQYEYLSYGLTAAWVILGVYVLMMAARERRLKREIAGLRAMLEEKHAPAAERREPGASTKA